MTKIERQTYQAIVTAIETLKQEEYAGYSHIQALFNSDSEIRTSPKFLQLLKTLCIAEM
jgi:hypothetical protein